MLSAYVLAMYLSSTTGSLDVFSAYKFSSMLMSSDDGSLISRYCVGPLDFCPYKHS